MFVEVRAANPEELREKIEGMKALLIDCGAPPDASAGRPTAESRPSYLSPRQVAARLHLKEQTLAAWRVRGTGPSYIKTGRKVLYALPDVETWEAEQRRTNTAQNA